MKVSIVTISYNQAEFLERAIQSVLGQDYKNVEYIVVDPGSTDGSRDIIARYRNRLAHVILEPDCGPADGLNKGFARANGDIFGFLNADDVLLPRAVAAVVGFFAGNPNIDVVSGHSLIIDKADRALRKSYSDCFSLFRTAYNACVLMQQSTFFRAEVFRRVSGFAIDNRVAWDGELFIDMALGGARFALVDEFWSGFRIHQDSITSSKRLDALTKAYQARVFQKIMGREMRWIDWPLLLLCRIVKHANNPKGLAERLLRGPIYGRHAA